MLRLKKRHFSVDMDKDAYWFIIPFFILTFLFIILPIIANIFLSFTNYNIMKMEWVGLSNYKFLFEDKRLWKSLLNTLIFTIFNLPICMVLGLMLALIMKRGLFGHTFFQAGIYIPYIISMVSASMIWIFMMEPLNGLFNTILKAMGLKGIKWLYSTDTAMISVIITSVWKNMGYFMVIFLSGLQSIPSYVYEAARIDGSGAINTFFKITLPLLRPTTFFLFITGFNNNFRVFEQVKVMTGGGPENSTTTIVHQIYSRAFSDMKLGYAAAEAILLLLIVSTITLINFKYSNQGEDLEAI